MSYSNWEKLTKRRTFIVDRKFQFDIIFRAATYWMFLLAVFGVGLFLPILRDLDRDGPDVADTATAMLYMHEQFWPVAILCPFLGLMWSLRFSHRIAGPMVRVKRALVEFAEGIVPNPITTRTGDYMQNEVDHVNRAAEGLRSRVSALHDAETSLATSLRACERHVEASTDAELLKAFATLKASAQELRTASRGIRLAGKDQMPAAASAETDTSELIAN